MASLDQEAKPPEIDIQKLDKTDILKLIEQWKIMPIIKSEGNDNILFLATENVIELQAKLDESKFLFTVHNFFNIKNCCCMENIFYY